MRSLPETEVAFKRIKAALTFAKENELRVEAVAPEIRALASHVGQRSAEEKNERVIGKRRRHEDRAS